MIRTLVFVLIALVFWWLTGFSLAGSLLVYIGVLCFKIQGFYTYQNGFMAVFVLECICVISFSVHMYDSYGLAMSIATTFILALLLPFFYRLCKEFTPIETGSNVLTTPEPLSLSGKKTTVHITSGQPSNIGSKKSAFKCEFFSKYWFCTEKDDSEFYDFICNLHQVIVSSNYAQPLLPESSPGIFKKELCAFYDEHRGVCGLQYENACMELPSAQVNEFILVEYTCRNRSWFSLVINVDGELIEMSFDKLHEDRLSMLQMSVSFSYAWNSQLRQAMVNLN